ncbi:hypothetical protein B0T22DRAFT_435019 [Podospora appendiculata]|uniref:DnaJ homologue subfamily C member 28 conserved domain-containing protein n=1 Tax=Podospora appendiculata TaxID=314037 RepID=A0AAE0WZ03_9PEZI|nr:hypothetical protein B0T22DRAFT_435019 [Podospora appendiculata]
MAPARLSCGRCLRTLHTKNHLRTLPAARLVSQSARLSHSANASNPPTSTSTSTSTPPHSESSTTHNASSTTPPPPDEPKPPDTSPEPQQGPMARRLQETTEEALFTGGRAGRRAVEEAGFSEELKTKLLAKIADTQFRHENAAALAEAGITAAVPDAAGRGTRDIAAAQAWTGAELPEDTVLRMLHDARKPLAPGLRGKPGIPAPVVDMRVRRAPAVSAGRKAEMARDKAQAYAGLGVKEVGMSAEERERFQKELKERFGSTARAMPNTISGLAALANERIEDAIARGQFKNIPRGRGVERDARADNPFIDTTEYILNKMIKRQEIVPPWIEKQQELLKAASHFRARLRTDWKRHAARMIASRGGSLQEQMNRAAEYARAEEVHNPRRRNVEHISVPTNATNDAVMVQIRQTPSTSTSQDSATASHPDTETPTLTRPFRDPDWEAAELAYIKLAIGNLNNITRSYNLMAPELAKKPYFSVERELSSCFADIAPLLADTIKARAVRPAKSPFESYGGQQSGGMLGRFTGDGTPVRVYESKAPPYGFKEFWRDLWKKE